MRETLRKMESACVLFWEKKKEFLMTLKLLVLSVTPKNRSSVRSKHELNVLKWCGQLRSKKINNE